MTQDREKNADPPRYHGEGMTLEEALARVQELEADVNEWRQKFAMRSKLEKDNFERAEAAKARAVGFQRQVENLLKKGEQRRDEDRSHIEQLEREVAELKIGRDRLGLQLVADIATERCIACGRPVNVGDHDPVFGSCEDVKPSKVALGNDDGEGSEW